ncbi:reverse transcriptase domain-containing protein [Citrus sinensis]|nr:reverse transcriptase domain-containing protein [Citrus sinensis]
MGSFMDQPFTKEDVADALAQMCPTKAPGPDGLPAAFFQKHWGSVQQDVITTCLHGLNEGGNIALLNHTYLALIPKVQKPRKVTDFIPISLCNVIYRIIAKTLANRLKKILHVIISPTQSAFVPNRLITDNLIIGYECLNKIRQSKSKRNGLVAHKLDISKAYDRVEWEFVKCTMQKLGFSEKWVKLIMNCITTTSFSVLINGVAKGLIHPQRGLRQGCPLSHYLFIMCAEVFSNLMVNAKNQKLINGLKFSRDLSVTHLLFADDSLVFTKASINDCRNLRKIFDNYAAASGQVFNFKKSFMFFSSSTSSGQREEIRSIFGLNVVSKHEKYLGLPSMIGRKKTCFFNDIKLRVLSKLSSWQNKCFSSEGKEILIKAVAQAVPTYAMNVFKIPQGLCDDIQKAVARFWWGSSETHRSIHWARWEKLCQAKIRGGLGFRDFSSFNQALVAKQGWRILHNPDGLMSKILKAKYFKHTDFIEAKLGSNPSFVWRKNVVVADFIDDKNQWMKEKVVQCFPEEVAQRILRTPLPRTPQEDRMIWHFDKYGCYSVRSGHQVAVRMKFPDNPECSDSSKTQWKVIWSNEIPEKIKIFMWRAAQNLLPTANNLWRKNVHDILSMLQELASRRMKEEIEQILAICWAIWYVRNRFVIEGKQEEPKLTAARASAIVESYKRIKTQNGPARSIHHQNNQQIWTPPPEGKYKVNVDAAIQMAGLKAGLRAVVRNSNGKIITAAVKKVCFQGTVASMEAEAVIFGIQVAQQVEYLPMIIESDSTEVVELVWSRKSSLTEVSWAVKEIKQQLQISNAFSLQYVPRKCNAIAHAIAKVALDFENSVIWLEEFPVKIMMLLSNFIN